jgi:hypothetical protein
MRVLVTGCRDWLDEAAVFTELSRCYVEACRDGKRLHVVHGAAAGADAFASKWCMMRNDIGISEERYPADWKTHGKAAGHIRNAKMITENPPELCLAFWDGRSPGTHDMITKCAMAGIPVRIVPKKAYP